MDQKDEKIKTLIRNITRARSAATKNFYPTLLNRVSSSQELREYTLQGPLKEATQRYEENLKIVLQTVRNERRSPTTGEFERVRDAALEIQRATESLGNMIEDEVTILSKMMDDLRAGRVPPPL